MLKRKFSLNLEGSYLGFLRQTTVRKKKHQNGFNIAKHLQYDHMITSKNFNHNLKSLSHLFNSKIESTTGTQCTVHKAFPGTSISKNWQAKPVPLKREFSCYSGLSILKTYAQHRQVFSQTLRKGLFYFQFDWSSPPVLTSGK